MERTDTEMLEWVIAHDARLSRSDTFSDGDRDWICRFRPHRFSGPVVSFGPSSRAAIASGMLWMSTTSVSAIGNSSVVMDIDTLGVLTVTKYCAKCFKIEVKSLGDICAECAEGGESDG